jgi:hypothetical protein
MLTVFPNPASQSMTIHFPSYKNQIHYSISDVSGKKLLDEKIISSGVTEAKADVSHLAPGLYFLEVNADENRIVKKLVVAR